MTKIFETTTMNILIDSTTYSGSAFGVSDQGEAVFFNARVLKALDLEEGDMVQAACIPNYEDKRHDIPWRCIRATKLEEGVAAPAPVERTAAEIDAAILIEIMSQPEDSYVLTSEVAEMVDVTSTTASNSLTRLFNAGKIVKGEIYSRPGLTQPSFNVWALDVAAFK